MLERIKISLFHPALIGKYANDGFFRILLFILLISSFSLIVPIVKVINFDNISDEYSEAIFDLFEKAESSFPEARIEDYKLTYYDEKDIQLSFGTFRFQFNSVDNAFGELCFSFQEEKVVLHNMGIEVLEISYEDLGVKSLDFNKICNKDLDESFIEREKFRMAIGSAIEQTKPAWGIAYIFVDFIIQVLYFLLTLAMVTVLFKLFQPLSFNDTFHVCVYGLTVLRLSILLGRMFSLEWLEFIGIILSSFFIYRAMRILLINRIIQQKVEKSKEGKK